MTLRRIGLLALSVGVASFGIFVAISIWQPNSVISLWRPNPNWDLENRAFGYLKSGSPKAMPLLLELGRRGDRAAAGVLTEIYVTGDPDLGVVANDRTATYWAKRSSDEVGTEVYYAKAFLGGTDPTISRDPARSEYWLTQAYNREREKVR